MKKIRLFVLFTLLSLSVQGQGFHAGTYIGLPTGETADIYSFSLGAEIGYLWPVSNDFSLGTAVGYSHIFGKSETRGSYFGGVPVWDNVAFLPIAVATRLSLSNTFTLGADIGYGIGITDDNEGGFYYRPMIGFILPGVDISLSYRGFSETNFHYTTITLGFSLRFS